MVDPSQVFLGSALALWLLVQARPWRLLRVVRRRSKRPATDGLAVRPRIPAPLLDTSHRW